MLRSWLQKLIVISAGIGAVPGLQDGVRKVILDSYSRTCRKISKSALAESLRLDSSAVDDLV